jgi:hypothetical protein
MQNCSTKVPSVLFYEEIRWIKLNKIAILPFFPYNPKAKLRLEVLFKKFHPRINLTTLFLTKSYLLNTLKPFLKISSWNSAKHKTYGQNIMFKYYCMAFKWKLLVLHSKIQKNTFWFFTCTIFIVEKQVQSKKLLVTHWVKTIQNRYCLKRKKFFMYFVVSFKKCAFWFVLKTETTLSKIFF